MKRCFSILIFFFLICINADNILSSSYITIPFKTEKIIERVTYELKIIEEAKKYIQIEHFINSEKIELCLMPNEEVINKQSNKSEEQKVNNKNKEIKNIEKDTEDDGKENVTDEEEENGQIQQFNNLEIKEHINKNNKSKDKVNP